MVASVNYSSMRSQQGSISLSGGGLCWGQTTRPNHSHPSSLFVYVVIVMGSEGPSRSKPAQASFKVQPKMTKWEVKEYLTKIYNVPVKKARRISLKKLEI